MISALAVLAAAATQGFAAGASSLALSHDSRADALGIGYVADVNNASAMDVNPAGLVKLQRPEASLFYSNYLVSTQLTALSAAAPSTALGSLGVSYMGMTSSSFDGRDASGNATGSFSTNDRVFGLAVGRVLNDEGSAALGVNVKYLQSDLHAASGSTAAMDVGGLYRIARWELTLGAAARNLGRGISYGGGAVEPLPAQVAFGAAWSLPKLPAGLVVGAQNGLHGGGTAASVALEAQLAGGALALRGGFLAASGGAAPGVSGGVGLKLGSYLLDASVVPTGALGMATKVNLTMRFGRDPSVRPVRRPEEEFDGVYSLGI